MFLIVDQVGSTDLMHAVDIPKYGHWTGVKHSNPRAAKIKSIGS